MSQKFVNRSNFQKILAFRRPTLDLNVAIHDFLAGSNSFFDKTPKNWGTHFLRALNALVFNFQHFLSLTFICISSRLGDIGVQRFLFFLKNFQISKKVIFSKFDKMLHPRV